MITSAALIRIILVSLLVLLLIVFAAISITINLFGNKDSNIDASISLYGLLIVIYLIIETSFAVLNRIKINDIRRGKVSDQKRDDRKQIINCIIPGYREEPQYYHACLSSYLHISESADMQIKHIIFLIDGMDNEDQYMIDIFKEIYQDNGQIIELSSMGAVESLVFNKRFICITQPHGGKRDVLYTGFKIAILDPEVTAVVTSDSDSIMETDSVMELTAMLRDRRIHAATGSVRIFNDTTTISYMSALRYFYASNLERAYESYNGCVLCMSGPLSIYRADTVEKFIDKWYHQTFLGKPCTYGDDRHLTNCILEAGGRAVFTPFALCITETPQTLTRFLRQQLRWNKSSIRELSWTLKFISKHSIWMTIDVAYQTLYSLFIFCSIIYLVYAGSPSNMITYCYGLIIIAFLRSLYGVILTMQPKYLLYSYYSIIYLGLMIPLKLYAAINLKDTAWGTLGRKLDTSALGEWLSVSIWNLFLLIGLIIKFTTVKESITNTQLYLLLGIPLYFLTLFIITFLLARYNKYRYAKHVPTDIWLQNQAKRQVREHNV